MPMQLQHFKAECRFSNFLLALTMLSILLLSPAVLSFWVPAGVISRVMVLTRHPNWVATAFIQLSILLAPYMIMQAIAPEFEHRRKVVKVACFALSAGSVLWMYLAYVSRNLDMPAVGWIFYLDASLLLAFALGLALQLNHQQQRGEVAPKGAIREA
jgi:hypothetical protein